MANETPDTVEFDAQDLAEVFDETHLTDDDDDDIAPDQALDVYDFTSALGDAREVPALDAADVDLRALDDEDLETDEDVDDHLDDDLEDASESQDIDAEDEDTEDGVVRLSLEEADIETVADVDRFSDADDEEADYESDVLSDDDVKDLGYDDKGEAPGPKPEDTPDESDPHQEELLDEGVEETFPASDPVSVKRIT